MKLTSRLPRAASCRRQPLEALLAGKLSDRSTARLTKHLNRCETCQQRITTLAAEPGWWLDASRWLEPETPDFDAAADDLGDLLLAEFDTYPDSKRELLECGLLEASTDPAMIGKLGRYDVKKVLGAGGTGIVLQAIDSELSRPVAIKVLAPTLAAHGAARKRFARESQAVAAVAHENVVAVHHVEGNGRIPYLVMQYVEGNSLQERIIQDGPLDATTVLRMTAQLAAALSAAHDQGLVHRDVKPANILVGPAGQRVWITDFGLARAVDDASLTRTGFIAGTPHYMSPEQARGATVRASSDLFGLGGVVYFMLTGRPPFRAERTLAILNRICDEPHRPIREINPHVPPALSELVDRLLAKAPADRFSSAAETRDACLRLLAQQTSPDQRPSLGQPSERSTTLPRRPGFTIPRAAGAIVALSLLALCLAGIVDLSRHLRHPTGNPGTTPVADAMRSEAVLASLPAADRAPALPAGLNVPATRPPRQPDSRREDAPWGQPGPAPLAVAEAEFEAPERLRGNEFGAWNSVDSNAPPATIGRAATNAVQPFGATPRPASNRPPATLSTVRPAPSVDESAIWLQGFQDLERELLEFDDQMTNRRHAALPFDGSAVLDRSFSDSVRWAETIVEQLSDRPETPHEHPPATPYF